MKWETTVAIVTMVVLLCVTTASASWGNLVTHTMRKTFLIPVTETSDARSYKTTNSIGWDALVTAITTDRNPTVKLVNSNDEDRSGSITIRTSIVNDSDPDNGDYAIFSTSSGNTGSPGYYYWVQVTPNWLQGSSRSMRFKINAR